MNEPVLLPPWLQHSIVGIRNIQIELVLGVIVKIGRFEKHGWFGFLGFIRRRPGLDTVDSTVFVVHDAGLPKIIEKDINLIGDHGVGDGTVSRSDLVVAGGWVFHDVDEDLPNTHCRAFSPVPAGVGFEGAQNELFVSPLEVDLVENGVLPSVVDIGYPLGAVECSVKDEWIISSHIRPDIQPLVPGSCEVWFGIVGSAATEELSIMNQIILFLVEVEDDLPAVFDLLPSSGFVPDPNISKENSSHTIFIWLSVKASVDVAVQLDAEHIPTVNHLHSERGVEVLGVCQVAKFVEEIFVSLLIQRADHFFLLRVDGTRNMMPELCLTGASIVIEVVNTVLLIVILIGIVQVFLVQWDTIQFAFFVKEDREERPLIPGYGEQLLFPACNSPLCQFEPEFDGDVIVSLADIWYIVNCEFSTLNWFQELEFSESVITAFFEVKSVFTLLAGEAIPGDVEVDGAVVVDLSQAFGEDAAQHVVKGAAKNFEPISIGVSSRDPVFQDCGRAIDEAVIVEAPVEHGTGGCLIGR